tara:strand:+ start:577 stop:852 length:276 start_codon:yes stop_codon:yes gene_type:complete
MAVWKIIRETDNKGTIYKDGVPYGDLDISWLPSTIRAVQGQGDGSAYLEKINTETDFVSDLSAESWHSNMSETWQDAEDAVQSPQLYDGSV